MTIITAQTPTAAVATVQALGLSIKNAANAYIAYLQANNVDTVWVFQFLDTCRNTNAQLNNLFNLSGLNAAATSLIPGYSGTMSNDITAVMNAITACITWIVTNFPKDSTNTYILGTVLNSDGSRTQRQFTPTQTAGLVTQLQAVVALIN